MNKKELINEIRNSLDTWRDNLWEIERQTIRFEDMEMDIFAGEVIADFFDQIDDELKKKANKLK